MRDYRELHYKNAIVKRLKAAGVDVWPIETKISKGVSDLLYCCPNTGPGVIEVKMVEWAKPEKGIKLRHALNAHQLHFLKTTGNFINAYVLVGDDGAQTMVWSAAELDQRHSNEVWPWRNSVSLPAALRMLGLYTT